MMCAVESNWTLIPFFSISNNTSTAMNCTYCKKKMNTSSLRKYQTPTICSSTPTTMINLPISGIPLIPWYIFQSAATQLGIKCGSWMSIQTMVQDVFFGRYLLLYGLTEPYGTTEEFQMKCMKSPCLWLQKCLNKEGKYITIYSKTMPCCYQIHRHLKCTALFTQE
jgi:hypothetical protein